ncbi:Postreplication repair E3 ubiquitin-protein ligase rad18 (RING-type E3 ubiquitin transferase rad18) (UV radiation sensitivity protein 2), partial [Durusdinium trenchii]
INKKKAIAREASQGDEWTWRDTALRGLEGVEQALRCPICQGFLAGAASLSLCGHSFCMLCLRRAVQIKPECPQCRKKCCSSDVNKNAALDAAVRAFVRARPAVLTAAKLLPRDAGRTSVDGNDGRTGADAPQDGSLRRSQASGGKRVVPTRRIPNMVFRLVKDKELKEHLRKYDLPCTGSRTAMVSRFKEFALLYNSRVDSSLPVTPEVLTAIRREVTDKEVLLAKEKASTSIFDRTGLGSNAAKYESSPEFMARFKELRQMVLERESRNRKGKRRNGSKRKSNKRKGSQPDAKTAKKKRKNALGSDQRSLGATVQQHQGAGRAAKVETLSAGAVAPFGDGWRKAFHPKTRVTIHFNTKTLQALVEPAGAEPAAAEPAANASKRGVEEDKPPDPEPAPVQSIGSSSSSSQASEVIDLESDEGDNGGSTANASSSQAHPKRARQTTTTRVSRAMMNQLYNFLAAATSSKGPLPKYELGSRYDLGHYKLELVTRVDKDGPDVDQDKSPEVEPLVHGHHEDEQVVRYPLHETIDWVEGVRCKWRHDEPFVVPLVAVLVEQRVVQQAVDPVDEAVVPHQETEQAPKRVLHGALVQTVVELRVPSNFCHKEWQVEENHERDRGARGPNLPGYLVFQKLWVLLDSLIEQNDIRKGRHAKVQHVTARHGQHGETERLPLDVILCPVRRVHVRREQVLVCQRQQVVHSEPSRRCLGTMTTTTALASASTASLDGFALSSSASTTTSSSRHCRPVSLDGAPPPGVAERWRSARARSLPPRALNVRPLLARGMRCVFALVRGDCAIARLSFPGTFRASGSQKVRRRATKT